MSDKSPGPEMVTAVLAAFSFLGGALVTSIAGLRKLWSKDIKIEKLEDDYNKLHSALYTEEGTLNLVRPADLSGKLSNIERLLYKDGGGLNLVTMDYLKETRGDCAAGRAKDMQILKQEIIAEVKDAVADAVSEASRPIAQIPELCDLLSDIKKLHGK